MKRNHTLLLYLFSAIQVLALWFVAIQIIERVNILWFDMLWVVLMAPFLVIAPFGMFILMAVAAFYGLVWSYTEPALYYYFLEKKIKNARVKRLKKLSYIVVPFIFYSVFFIGFPVASPSISDQNNTMIQNTDTSTVEHIEIPRCRVATSEYLPDEAQYRDLCTMKNGCSWEHTGLPGEEYSYSCCPTDSSEREEIDATSGKHQYSECL